MNNTEFETLSQIYDLRAEVHLVTFENRRLSKLSQAISKLDAALGEQRQLNFWSDIIATLRKYRYDISVLPLPFLTPKVRPENLHLRLTRVAEGCETGFPEQLAKVKYLLDAVADLPDGIHPFMQWIQNRFPHSSENQPVVNLCLPRARYLRLVENHAAHPDFTGPVFNLINPVHLKQVQLYDHLIFCGSTGIYTKNPLCNREYVWRAPRARRLYFLSFSWIKDRFDPTPIFDLHDTPPNRVPLVVHRKEILEYCTDKQPDDDSGERVQTDFQDIDILPKDLIPDIPPGPGSPASEYDYHCNCRQIYLEDGSFLYKDVEGVSRVATLEPEFKTVKIDNLELEPGMFLVLRTEGSGDSIAAVADLLMGKKAAAVRRKQNEWKLALQKKLSGCASLAEAVSELQEYGAVRAREVNIRNWRSEDTIRPASFRDFKAILYFSGIYDHIESYWANAETIMRMHIKAGKEISRLLIRHISQQRRKSLEKYGRLDVEIQGLSGRLALIRIEAVSETLSMQPVSRVNRLFSYEV